MDNSTVSQERVFSIQLEKMIAVSIQFEYMIAVKRQQYLKLLSGSISNVTKLS